MRKWKPGVVGILMALATSSGTQAGWEITQVNYSLGPKGAPVAKRTSTLRVSKGRVRVADDPTTIIIDYAADRLMLLLPAKSLYWSGTTDDYLREVALMDRRKHLRRAGKANPKIRKQVEVVVKKSGDTALIAGRGAAKYVVTAGGKPFQEIWVASGLDLSADLDIQRLQAFQEKIAESARGGDRAAHAALARNQDYLQLYKGGFPVKTQSFLGKSIVGREVVAVTRADVADGEFSTPEGYTRTSLASLLEAQDGPGK